jgi:hypothetical protein
MFDEFSIVRLLPVFGRVGVLLQTYMVLACCTLGSIIYSLHADFNTPLCMFCQAHSIPLTKDEFKYSKSDVQAKVLAILTSGSGFVKSVSGSTEGQVGLVLDVTSFYAESGKLSRLDLL